MGLNARVAAGIQGVFSAAIPGSAEGAEARLNFGVPLEFLDGITAGRADTIHGQRAVINASSNLDLDLSGTLANMFGGPAVFAKVCAIFVRHVAGPNAVVIGNAAAAPFVGPFGAAAHTIAVAPTGEMVIGRTDLAGWPVVNAASDILRFANAAGGAITVDIVIIGRSA